MAEKKKKATISKKFGTRYGRPVKERYDNVAALQKKSYKCPSCSYEKVKRVAAGIWKCDKCGSKFASRAYSIPKIGSSEQQTQVVFDENVEEKTEG